jgi:hypothetical protein
MVQSRIKPPARKGSKRWYEERKMTFDKSIKKNYQYLKNWEKINGKPK